MYAQLDHRSGLELQGELRDLLCLAIAGDHVRWVLRGGEGAELSEWLGGAITQWRGWADQVARHLVALGVAPDARLRALAKDMALNWVPDGWLDPEEARRLVDHRVHAAVRWARLRSAEAADADTVQLLNIVSAGLAAQARAVTRSQ
jgi:starvation-inducible DNA-binding protein